MAEGPILEFQPKDPEVPGYGKIPILSRKFGYVEICNIIIYLKIKFTWDVKRETDIKHVKNSYYFSMTL